MAAVRSFLNPSTWGTWDFLCFYLDGSVAIRSLNVYDPLLRSCWIRSKNSAYDTHGCYRAIATRGATATIRPLESAMPWAVDEMTPLRSGAQGTKHRNFNASLSTGKFVGRAGR